MSLLDWTVWIAVLVAEAVVIAILIRKQIVRLFPAFTLYLALGLVNDIVLMFVSTKFPSAYFRSYTVSTWVDSIVQFAVLVELAWSVLRPYRAVLPKATVLIIAVLVLIAGAAVWPFTGAAGLHIPPEWQRLLRMQQTFSTLRILVFLGLASLSQLLTIGWRNRELQVATGLGFYSLVSMASSLMQTHHATLLQFHLVETAVSASYLVSLVYWAYSFVREESPRQEFTPGMQNLLLSLAGAARSSRLGLEDIRKTSKR